MARFPYFGYNYPYYRKYQNYYSQFNSQHTSEVGNKKNSITDNSLHSNTIDVSENCKKESQEPNEKRNIKNIGPVSFNMDFFSHPEEPILNILGITLYLDDIIILCLLFFLYKEEVKDEMLYICLILLLLS